MRLFFVWTVFFFTLCSCLAAPRIYLLSDNIAPGEKSSLVAADAGIIHTGAKYSFVTNGEFATCRGALESVSGKGGVKVLFDGSEWWKSQTYGDWDGGLWTTVEVDLCKPYLVGEVSVRALRQAQRDMEFAQILFSADGKNFSNYGKAESNAPVPDGKGAFVSHSARFDPPVSARYVLIRMKRGRHQLQVSEIAVYGWETDSPDAPRRYLKSGEKHPIKLTARTIQDGAAFLDWSAAAGDADGVKFWRVYFSDREFSGIGEEGVSFLKQFPAERTSAPVFPFEPGQTKYFAVTAVYGDGENSSAGPVPVRFREPFERLTFGDMLAVNYFPGGGAPVRGAAWTEVTLDLLSETPFRESRWWFMFPDTVMKFLDRGLGMITWPLIGDSALKDNVGNANSMGLYSFTKGNEPELKGISPEDYVAGLKKERAAARRKSSWNRISAPTCNIWPSALEWLDGFYRAGAKDFFDVLDLHTYTTPPEDLFERMEKVRGIMKKYGDDGKPVISTEFGYADTPEGPEGISALAKAQYLVRGLVIHYVLGFRRVYVYSFADAGDDPHYNEHHFGLLDRDLQKKPAYYAVCTLGVQLGNCVLAGKLDGVSGTMYGYTFEDAGSKEKVHVIWDAGKELDCEFFAESGSVEIVEMLGGRRKLATGADGKFKLRIGPSPVYVRTKGQLEIVSAEEAGGAGGMAAQGGMAFSIADSCAYVAPEEKVRVRAALTNNTDEAVSGVLTVRGAGGNAVFSQDAAVPPGGSLPVEIVFEPEFDGENALARYSVRFDCEYGGSSFSEERVLFVRRLSEIPPDGVAAGFVRFGEYENEIAVLANRFLEAAFDPSNGGRMLELVDRRTRTNQIRIDYGKIPVLSSFSHSYAVRFAFDGDVKDGKWNAAAVSNGLVLSRSAERFGAAMKWTLNPEVPRLELEVEVRGKAGGGEKTRFCIHPEYVLSGRADSGADVISFPVEGRVFKLPYWVDLGEMSVPELSDCWWSVSDENAGLLLKQTFHGGWFPPRVWFGSGWYNVEMSCPADISEGGVEVFGIDWTLGWSENRKERGAK